MIARQRHVHHGGTEDTEDSWSAAVIGQRSCPLSRCREISQPHSHFVRNRPRTWSHQTRRRSMNKPLLGIGIALVAFGLIAGAVAFSFRDDWRDDDPVEYRVTNAQGQPTGSVVVVENDHWRRGPGFFPLFPFVLVGGVLIVVAVFARGGRHWNGGGRRDFEDWHRETHWNWGSPVPNEPPSAPPP